MDIHNKEFSVKMRGYDQDEVNDYLDQIIKHIEKLTRENKELEEKLRFSKEKLTHYDSIHDSLNRSILVAQEAADRLKENTTKEVEVMKKEAESNANQLLQDAVEKARRIKSETEELRQQSLVFRQRLQIMVESQLEMLKNTDWDDVLRARKTEVILTPTIEEVTEKLTEDGKTLQLESETKEKEQPELLEENANQEEAYEEGTTPAVELPSLSNE